MSDSHEVIYEQEDDLLLAAMTGDVLRYASVGQATGAVAAGALLGAAAGLVDGAGGGAAWGERLGRRWRIGRTPKTVYDVDVALTRPAPAVLVHARNLLRARGMLLDDDPGSMPPEVTARAIARTDVVRGIMRAERWHRTPAVVTCLVTAAGPGQTQLHVRAAAKEVRGWLAGGTARKAAERMVAALTAGP